MINKEEYNLIRDFNSYVLCFMYIYPIFISIVVETIVFGVPMVLGTKFVTDKFSFFIYVLYCVPLFYVNEKIGDKIFSKALDIACDFIAEATMRMSFKYKTVYTIYIEHISNTFSKVNGMRMRKTSYGEECKKYYMIPYVITFVIFFTFFLLFPRRMI